MTESKLVPVDAMVVEAIRDEVGPVVSKAQALAEIQKVLGRPGAVAKALIPETAYKAPKKGVVDARSTQTLDRAAYALLASGGSEEAPEVAIGRAMERAGLTKDMLAQTLESPEWPAVVARLCQQYLYVTSLPRIVAAQVTKAGLGHTSAFKALMEAFKGSALDRFDEQTRAMAEAAPETRVRHTKALIEDLQRMVDEAEGAGAKEDAVRAAQEKAEAALTERRKQS